MLKEKEVCKLDHFTLCIVFIFEGRACSGWGFTGRGVSNDVWQPRAACRDISPTCLQDFRAVRVAFDLNTKSIALPLLSHFISVRDRSRVLTRSGRKRTEPAVSLTGSRFLFLHSHRQTQDLLTNYRLVHKADRERLEPFPMPLRYRFTLLASTTDDSCQT